MSERKGGVAVLFAARKRVSAGLYVGGRSFVYLALEESGGEVRVAASSSGTFQSQLGNGGSPFSASEAELSQAFGRVASSVKAARRHEVNFAVPMTESLLRVIPMQGLTRAEAKRAFRYEAESHFPFGSDDCVYDLDEIDYPLGGGSSERRFVVSAARRRTAEGVCRAARSCGISFGAMEPEQTAIERAASPAFPSEGGCVCVYAGIERSLVIFVWRGCGIYYRNIALGTDAGGRSLDESAAALAEEVRASVQFGLSRNEGFAFNDIFLFGPGAAGRFCAVLSDVFPERSVKTVFPERRFGLDFPSCEGWTAALGLALREYDGQA